MLSVYEAVPQRELVIIMHSMVMALKTLHNEASITHRLVEPSHVFKMKDGSYKLGGFDMATTEIQGKLGSIAFSPPEINGFDKKFLSSASSAFQIRYLRPWSIYLLHDFWNST